MMGRASEYTIMGPPRDPRALSPPSTSKSLPYRNDSKAGSPNLRTLYRISAQEHAAGHQAEELSQPSLSTVLPTSPNLPPTPPGASNGNNAAAPPEEALSEAAVFRSTLVTPINQNSPPTPDNTPPREVNGLFRRPFLGTQPSFASTRAESFKTAQEDIMSESESEPRSQRQDAPFQWPLSSVNTFGPVAHRLRHSSLPGSPLVNNYGREIVPTPSPESFDRLDDGRIDNFKIRARTIREPATRLSTAATPEERNGEMLQIRLDPASDLGHLPQQFRKDHSYSGLKRDKSLRERLLEAQSQDPSASTEKFADIIGWNNSVPIEDGPVENREVPRDESRRYSGISTTSTIEAFVVEQNPVPRRQTTLRHVSKHESLRSVSSPLPASNRNSLHSSSDSPHRLVHKKAKLSNQNRWSFGSEVSRSYSLASSAALPKTEIIRVAVIPERSSSLPSSANDSTRQSLSTSSGKSRKALNNPPSSWQHKRAFSESRDRGREQAQGLLIPPRSSSLSAPTSRSTSRANSVTSEHLHVRRQQAEKDLRKTLDRMESERLVNHLREWDSRGQIKVAEERAKVNHPRQSFGHATTRASSLPAMLLGPLGESTDVASNALGLAAPGSEEWAALRPPSLLETPFSQPSFQSASPEISEARAINYFPHNNHSLQLIEPFPIGESKAVQEVQKQTLPEKEIESPLRNPRRPPDPPHFQIIPPTPGDEHEQQLVHSGLPTKQGGGSLKRPGGSRRRSESFINSVSRNLSLKNARNRKADQDLDGSLHPFWRPRAFWDDDESARTDRQHEARPLERGIVNNSLGLPQERIVVTGPVSLVRRISERRRQRRGIVKQSSHGSLVKTRAGRRLHQLPGLGLRFHLIVVRDIQERIMRAQQRKEDEKREKKRQDLRRSIGAIVISQSDSRFPASNSNLLPTHV